MHKIMTKSMPEELCKTLLRMTSGYNLAFYKDSLAIVMQHGLDLA